MVKSTCSPTGPEFCPQHPHRASYNSPVTPVPRELRPPRASLTYANTHRDTGIKVKIILKKKTNKPTSPGPFRPVFSFKGLEVLGSRENRIRYRTYSNFADWVVDPFIAAHFL